MTSDVLNAKQCPSRQLHSLDDHLDRILLEGSTFDLGGCRGPATDILPEWLLGPLPDGNKILPLGDQVEVERMLLKESLRKTSPSLNCSHVKGSGSLERGAGQTLLEQADKEPFISLQLSKVPVVCLQM